MKKVVLASLLISGATCAYNPAYADGKYYLEIGKPVGPEQAEKNWHGLTAKHKTLLKGLWYYPKTQYQNNMVSGTLIQAGPVSTKESAQKICSTLFKSDVACFVIEDMERAPPKTVATLSEKVEEKSRSIRIISDEPVVIAQATPPAKKEDDESFWSFLPDVSSDEEEKPKRQPEPVKPVPAVKAQKDDDSDSMWSWVPSISDDDEEKEPAPVVVETRESAPVSIESRDVEVAGPGNVQVAEAIRVPLSQNENKFRDEVAPSRSPSFGGSSNGGNTGALPAANLLQANPVVTTPEVQKMRSGSSDNSGWLNISVFLDENQASAIWQRVRSNAPQETANMRVRILRPLVTQKYADTSLNVGPFASDDEAMRFCSRNVKPVDSGLQCRFTHTEGLFTVGADNSYAARKQMMEASQGSTASTSNMRHESVKQYWVEVLSAKNQMKILDEWEELRTAHSDLFANKRSNVSRGGKNGSNYVVRVGPLKSDAEAQSLCSDLKNRDVKCAIAISSR